MIYNIDQPKFAGTDAGLVDYFHENGYVIVRSVASAQEVEHATSLLWEFLHEQTPMRKVGSVLPLECVSKQ